MGETLCLAGCGSQTGWRSARDLATRRCCAYMPFRDAARYRSRLRPATVTNVYYYGDGQRSWDS
jgi:hypothetical protein